MKIYVLFLFTLTLLTAGCVVGFSNMQNHVPEEFANVYVPAARDSSIYGGNSGRLSQAVRQKLSERTDIHLTNLKNARWALQIKILDRNQSIVAVDSCKNPSTPSVASGAYLCTAIHPELTNTDKAKSNAPTSFNQPSVSPSQEKLSLWVETKAIDLNSGATMWAKLYNASNIPAVVFNEIGDTDGSTMKYTQWTPDLHPLRYQEAVDNAVLAFSNAIASDIQKMVFASMPQNGSTQK